MLGFGFTSCPDVCPTTLGTLAQARRKLGAAAANVQVVYVTVDPERDVAERMKKYLRSFDPTFVGGTGTPEQLAAVRKDYGVIAEKKAFGNGYIVCALLLHVSDRSQRPAARADAVWAQPDDYVHDLKILLEE